MAQADNPSRLLRRIEAAAHVEQTFGIPCTQKTLARLAVVGGGPAYRKAGPFPLYSIPDLDTWAKAKLGPLVRTTSEAKEAA